jgi:multidrug efflux system outer membrane protein
MSSATSIARLRRYVLCAGLLRRGLIPLGAAVVTILVGCVSAPPSHEEIQAQALEGVSLPSSWKSGGTANAGVVGDGWLTSFGDPQLEALVAEAIARNPDLRVAAAKVEQADAAVDIAQAQLRPAVGLLARASSKPVSDLVAVLSGAILKVWWEIDLWGRMRYARNAARAERDAAGADYRFAQQSIAAATARAWFLATETAMQARLSQDMARGADQLVTLADQRQRIGAGSEKDVALARANAATYQDAARQVELAHRQALRALELLLGRYPAAEIQARTDLVAFPGPVPAGIPAQALERRPDMIAAERRVAAAFNRVGEAKRAMLPTLTLSGNVGWVDNDVEDINNDRGNSQRSAAAQVTAPIYAGGALMGKVHLRSAEQKQAVAEYGQSALRALNEVEDALDAENIAGERERILRQALDDSRRALQLEQTSYRIGKADLRDVTQGQLAAYAAEIALLHIRRDHLYRRVDLHLALGGGFATAPEEPHDPAATAQATPHPDADIGTTR